jgi:hypothetical protein
MNMTTIKNILEEADRACSSSNRGHYANERQVAVTNYLLAKLIQMKEKEIGEVDDI